MYNPALLVGAYYIDDADRPGKRINLDTVAQHIIQMDISAEQRDGHVLGLWAARLSLDYVEKTANPVHEQALPIGMLATLGSYLSEGHSVPAAAIDYAWTYQRQILFSCVLDDPQQEGTYAVSNARSFSSIAQRQMLGIRLQPDNYADGRQEFHKYWDDAVQLYKDRIRHTPPGDAIGWYAQNPDQADLFRAFVQLRKALQAYTPTLIATEQALWQYARRRHAHLKAQQTRWDQSERLRQQK